MIIYYLQRRAACGSVGTGRRARLRILWQQCRVGSSPIFRRREGPQDFVINVLRFFVYAEDYSPFVRQKEEKMEKIASFTMIIYYLQRRAACGSVGTGRRARLRILWQQCRVGSSPIFRINSPLFIRGLREQI